MNSRVLTVIVGDLVGSRKVRNRAELSRAVLRAIVQIDEAFRDAFHAPAELTRGVDEISAVLYDPGLSYRICTHLNEELHPHELRFAVVRGLIDVNVSSGDASSMDGPAFHRAADLVERAREKNRAILFDLGLKPPALEEALNEVVNLCHVLRRSWTDRQREAVTLYRRLGRQDLVAERLGVTQPGISRLLSKAHWTEIRHAETWIDTVLKRATWE